MKGKNRICIFLAIAIAFAALSLVSNAYYYSITPICRNNTCIEGETAKWEVLITNDGKHDVSFTSVELVDAKNNTAFAAEKREYFPQRDDRGDLIYVMQKTKTKINITGSIPSANEKKMHTYYPCFTLAIYDFYTIARDDKYEEEQCFSQNETMPIIECENSNHCSENQFCEDNLCVNLKCKDCQYVKDHSCVNYQCCDNVQCSAEESCQNNTCINLGCEFNQYSFNHTCKTLDCNFDEKIENQSCKKLECGFSEFAFNHTCTALSCSEDEFIINHTCRKLNCLEEEAIKNHLCIPLECMEDEFAYNHTCKKLDCWFFQDIKNHSCVNNQGAVTKLLLEIIAVIVILAFLLLDFGKFEKMHLRKKGSTKNEEKKNEELDKKSDEPIDLKKSDSIEDSLKEIQKETKSEEKPAAKENEKELPKAQDLNEKENKK